MTQAARQNEQMPYAVEMHYLFIPTIEVQARRVKQAARNQPDAGVDKACSKGFSAKTISQPITR